ncbi:putative holin [Achromobacter sp. UMC71]|uniref:putative holin n=1 Tax=Achromobacter sp. UMC71 TaxID=1862320 RepID=UPI0015FF7BD5|nr:putative holin [Achromobacter sp. UMC71]
MAEPSTITAAGTTLASGLALATLLPLVDANAAFGAVMGAALVASTKKDISAWKRFLSFIFSALCGYGGAGEFIAREWAKESFFPALFVALVIVPVALKVIAMAPDFDPSQLRAGLLKLLGGRNDSR